MVDLKERMEKSGLKREKNNRKHILKITMDSVQELMALGNDPKIKNKILSLAKNHVEIMSNFWVLYYDADKNYRAYLEKLAQEKDKKDEKEVSMLYHEIIDFEKENYEEIYGSYSKLSKRLENFVKEME